MLITTTDYPVRVSFSVLNKVLDEYTSESWSKAVGDAKLAEYVRKYQDPKQADTIMKVQQELDETKIVLVSAAFILSSCHRVGQAEGRWDRELEPWHEATREPKHLGWP